jgi:DNA-binding NarL/FixJ family response regulator
MIADSQTLAEQRYKELLEPEFKVVRVVPDLSRLKQSVRKTPPELAILDLDLAASEGFAAGAEIVREHSGVKLIYLTSVQDPSTAAEAFRSGASGILGKTCAAEELPHALRCVSRGESYLSSNLTNSTIEFLLKAAEERRHRRISDRRGPGRGSSENDTGKQRRSKPVANTTDLALEPRKPEGHPVRGGA